MTAALKLKYPPLPLALAAQAHTGPRIFVAEEVASEPEGSFTSSILAGCMNSCHWSRTLLYDVLQDLHDSLGPSAPYSFVDDLSQVPTGTEDQVRHALQATGIQIFTEFRKFGLTVSPTTVFLPKSSKAVQQAAKAIRAATGLKVSVKAAAADLGVDAAGGRRRSTIQNDERFGNAKKTNAKAAYLCKIDASASKLLFPGTMPTSI